MTKRQNLTQKYLFMFLQMILYRLSSDDLVLQGFEVIALGLIIPKIQ